MSKKQTNDPRSRKFALTSYHPIEVIEGVLEHRPVRAAVYIVHDKDTYTEEDEKENPEHKAGTLKDTHVHILLCSNNACTLGQVRRWFPSNQNTLGQVLKDDECMLRYLTHKDNPEKAQYSDNEVKTFGEGREPFLRAALSSGRSAETAEDLINDILKGVSTRMLVKRYGREFIVHRQAYLSTAAAIQTEERKYGATKIQEDWQKLCDLHETGLLGEYEFMLWAERFGVDVRAEERKNKKEG